MSELLHFDNNNNEVLHLDDGALTLELTSRNVTIAVIPHVTGLMSLFGSLFIIVDVLRDKKKHTTVFHRIMLGMSSFDFMASLFLFLSTWPLPKDTPFVHGAIGTLQTCQVQGFFIQLGVGTYFYSAYLAVYYLCMVRYQWKEQDFLKIEKWAHGLAILVSFGTSIASIFLTLYNSAQLWCWIASYPLACENSSKNNGETTCTRGDNAYIYRVAFFFVWMWLALIVVVVCMGLVVFTVYKQRKKMQKWNPAKTPSTQNLRRDSVLRATATQACLYIGAFILTAFFPSLARMVQARWNCTTTFYSVTILHVTFFPLQGFWNAFIYVKPRFQKASRDHPTWTVCQIVSFTVGRTLSCVLGQSRQDDEDYKLGTTYESPHHLSTTPETAPNETHHTTTAAAPQLDTSQNEEDGQSSPLTPDADSPTWSGTHHDLPLEEDKVASGQASSTS